MRESISVGTGVAAAAVLTHGVVLAAVRFDERVPISIYQEFFRQMVSATERLWSHGQGWQPMSHIRDFGQFFAPMVQMICPLIGFALFRTLSRRKIGIQIWKPVAIALLFAIPNGYIDLVPGDALPWAEAARTAFIVLLMVRSVGSLGIPGVTAPTPAPA